MSDCSAHPLGDARGIVKEASDASLKVLQKRNILKRYDCKGAGQCNIGIMWASGSISSTYWDLDTSGVSDHAEGAGNIPNDPGITGLTDAQLKSGLPHSFDPKIWGSNPNINDGYPYLRANPPK